MKRNVLRNFSIVFAILGAIWISGCAAPQPVGTIYTGMKLGVSGNATGYSKEGRATCRSIFSLFAFGDCSVETAAKAGSVTNVKIVDQEVKNILGIYGSYTTVVKGD